MLERERSDLAIDAEVLLVRIGVVPNSELVAGFARLDEKGYVATDNNCESTTSMLFAIGDVAMPISPTLATAVGQAATAAKSIKQRTEN